MPKTKVTGKHPHQQDQSNTGFVTINQLVDLARELRASANFNQSIASDKIRQSKKVRKECTIMACTLDYVVEAIDKITGSDTPMEHDLD